MALTTQPLKGTCSTSDPVPSLWSRGSKFKYCVPAFHVVGRKDRSISLKCRLYSSVGTSLVLGPNSKSFQISAFKGGSQYDYSGVGADETTTSSLAIQNLFKNWLMILRTPSQTQAVQKVHEEPSFSETSEMPNNLEKQSDEILKGVWRYFLVVDATIKVPILLLTLLYLAVNIVYGSRVSKELTPLWILGPFVVALYVKMFLSICRLYAFCFNQTAKVVKSLHVVCDYVVHWKHKKPLKTFIFQPLADLKHMNYNEVTRRKMRDLQGWLHEIYLDFLVLACPYHYRTSRFLKMFNFYHLFG